MFIVSSIERSSLKESKRAACRRIEEQERNRGVQERVYKEKQKKVARASETKPLLFLCVKGWRTKWGEGRKESRTEWVERERERERAKSWHQQGGKEYGRKIGSGRWWQCLSYLVWIAGWHRARQPRRSLIRGRQMMAAEDWRRVMPVRGKEREKGREGRKNNPALSCQLSAANEPLLPSSCSRFQETAVRDQSHGSIPANKPFNFAPSSPHSPFHGCASNYSACAVESRCICEGEWVGVSRRDRSENWCNWSLYTVLSGIECVIDWKPMEKIYLDRYQIGFEIDR